MTRSTIRDNYRLSLGFFFRVYPPKTVSRPGLRGIAPERGIMSPYQMGSIDASQRYLQSGGLIYPVRQSVHKLWAETRVFRGFMGPEPGILYSYRRFFEGPAPSGPKATILVGWAQ